MRHTFMLPLKQIFVCLTACLLYSLSLKAQSYNLWLPAAPLERPLALSEDSTLPQHFHTSLLNLKAWQQVQLHTSKEGTAHGTGQIISLPFPDGSLQKFKLQESPIMESGLASRYPAIKTYTAQGVDEPGTTARLDWTSNGLHAIILSPYGTFYIDPFNAGNPDHYISYNKKDYQHPGKGILNETIHESPADHEERKQNASLAAQGTDRSTGSFLRTYRIAIAATGEYTKYHGGTVEKSLAAIVTTMNRINAIFEREVAIRMILVNDNDKIIYTDHEKDPYTNDNGISMIYENQANLDSVIGSSNYDIGHVFSTAGGGVASLGSPCQDKNKAKGVTGVPNPKGDPFDVDYVAHEIGHQFGANHTFNGTSGFCSGSNRNANTAYEPGSGSTIMSYAGICSPQNLQGYSDDYFHSISFDEIYTFTTAGSGSLCGQSTETGNTPPIAIAINRNKTIPIKTPFKLTGTGTDADGDQLTYCWEQFDKGPAGAPDTSTPPAPLFRSFAATLDTARTFPRLSDLLSNTKRIGEVLPTVATKLNFRLTVRDNKSGGGGVNYDTLSVEVTDEAGPFMVSNPNTSLAWPNHSKQLVSWKVANTDKAPVNCQFVHILFSSNGGKNFNDTLAAYTPNDGSQEIIIPDLLTDSARIRIEAADNIFFDISDYNFTVHPIALNARTISQSQIDLNWTNSQQVSFVIERSEVNASQFAVLDTVEASTLAYQDTALKDATTYFYRLRPLKQGADYSNIANASTLPYPPVAPDTLIANASSQNQIKLEWSMSQSNQTSFILERSETNNLNYIRIAEISGMATAYLDTGLKASTSYFYRLQAANAGGPSPYTNEALAITPQPIPAAPSILTANAISDKQIDLNWMDNADNEDGFFIYRSSRTNTGFLLIDSVAANVTQYSSTLLKSNIKYFYLVRAYNSSGLSPASNQAEATTLITASIDTLTAIKMLVYPNPTIGNYSIQLKLPATGLITLKIWDQTGRLVKEEILHKKQFSQEWSFQLNHAPRGIYNLQLILPDQVIVQRLIKQ